MYTAKTYGTYSIHEEDDVFGDDSDVFEQPSIHDQPTATIPSNFIVKTDKSPSPLPYSLSIPVNQKPEQLANVPCRSNSIGPCITTESITGCPQPKNYLSHQLLFRVTHNQSMGTSPSGRATLPGARDPLFHPLHNPQFDWRKCLQRHGDKTNKTPSIGTSFTSNFLHALKIALAFHHKKKQDITFIVIQKAFLIPGTCLKFDDMVHWSGLAWETFGHKKKNEFLVVGTVPPAAVISRFTLESLERLMVRDLFPNLHVGSMPTLRLEELRAAMQMGSATFDVAKHQTKFFLACLLGNQDGVCPHDASTRLLVIHFVALARGCQFKHDTSIEEIGQGLDQETLEHVKTVVCNIKMLQQMNKERNIDINERFKYRKEDVEGAIKRWALENPVCNDFVTPRKPPSTQVWPRSDQSLTQPASRNSAPYDPFKSKPTGNKAFSLHKLPSPAQPTTNRPSTPSPAPPPTQALDSLGSFTPTSSFPSPPSTTPSRRARPSSIPLQSPLSPSKKRKTGHIREGCYPTSRVFE